MFRTVDIHGHLGYPSPVFEVEMVEEDGAVYLLMNEVELKKVNHRIPEKTIDKKIYIIPSFPHRVVDIEKTDKGRDLNSAKSVGRNEVHLGIAEQGQVWGKRFKFRFTSKNTGRKFDVNVRFKHRHDYDGYETSAFSAKAFKRPGDHLNDLQAPILKDLSQGGRLPPIDSWRLATDAKTGKK